MKKYKSILCMAIAGLMSLSCAACGGKQINRKLPGYVDGKKNLVFFVYDNEDVYEELASAFEGEEGNEEINIIIQKATDSYYEEVLKSYVGAQTPDVVFMKSSEIMPFLSGKTPKLLPLDDYIQKSQKMSLDDLWPINDCYRYDAASNMLGVEGAPLYGLIKDFSPDWTLVYNKEIFDTALNAMSDKSMASGIREKLERGARYPLDMTDKNATDYTLTWTEYYQLALQVKNSCTTESGQTINGTILDAGPEMMLMQWIQMNGEYLFSEDDKYCKSITDTQGIRAAFEMFRKLQDGAGSPANWSNSTAGGPTLLNQGKVASTCNGRWAFNEYNWIDNIEKFGYIPAPLPDDFDALTTTNYTLSSAIGGCMALCITSKCEYPDEAFKFIEYFFTEFEKEQAQQGYNISGNRSLAHEYMLDDSLDKKLLDLNTFYYNLGMNSSTMRYNRYLGTDSIYNILWLNFKAYFYENNHDSSDPNNAQWVQCLKNIERDLNAELKKYWS